jgi:hypothetical protein
MRLIRPSGPLINFDPEWPVSLSRRGQRPRFRGVRVLPISEGEIYLGRPKGAVATLAEGQAVRGARSHGIPNMRAQRNKLLQGAIQNIVARQLARNPRSKSFKI